MTKTRRLENPACTSASASSTISSLPSATCPCAQHSLHPGGAKPPSPGVQCHSRFHPSHPPPLLPLLVRLSLLQNGFYWLSKMPLFQLSLTFLSLLSPLFPFPFPLNPWERFGACLSEWTLPYPTLFSACTSPKPRFHRRPRHIDPSTWWAVVPEDHMLTQNPLIWSI